MKAIAFFLAALCAWAPVMADDAQRQATIAKIIEAQGLQEMFQQQLDQTQAAAAESGRRIFRKMLSQSGVPEGKEDPRLTEAFGRYMDRCARMFSAKEFVAAWSALYGKDLSDADLQQILAYYQSPVGKKDVLASQAAMAEFSKAILAEGEKRMSASVAQLMSEIRSLAVK